MQLTFHYLRPVPVTIGGQQLLLDQYVLADVVSWTGDRPSVGSAAESQAPMPSIATSPALVRGRDSTLWTIPAGYYAVVEQDAAA